MNKQRLLLAALAIFGFASCHQAGKNTSASTADSFHIAGTITGLDSGMVYLSHADTAGNMVIDSARLSNQKFSFKGSQLVPELYYLGIKGAKQPRLSFFVENSNIQINAVKDSLAKAAITGSATEIVYQNYKKLVHPVEAQIDSLNSQYQEAYKSKNEKQMAHLDSVYNGLDSTRKTLIGEFAKANPSSIVSAVIIARNLLFQPNVTQLSAAYNSLDSAVKQTSYGKKIKKSLDIAEMLAIGKPAPVFSQKDIHGKPFSLSSLKGKYVLVDFWASWCGPCRAENPNVVKAYNKFKNKDFTVLGVSLDEDSTAWVKAIQHDHLNWNQVSDLKGWKNAVAQEYGIMAIPSNFLLDKNGIIIGHDLRGDALENKLAEVLK